MKSVGQNVLKTYLTGFLCLGLLASSSLTFAQNEPVPATTPIQYEAYSSRPDILQAKPLHHAELDSSWRDMTRGHVEAVSMYLELYPDRDLYFLARDGEHLYDLAKLIARDSPKRLKRIHLINVSRANVGSKHLTDYLAQEGITKEALERGKKVMFIDTGFNGSIQTKIKTLFPQRLQAQIQSHLICSHNPSYPSSRVFLTAVNPAAAKLDPSELTTSISGYESLPKHMDRSDRYEQRNGKWEALSPVATTEKGADGLISPQRSREYMEDLAHTFSQPETKELIAKRRAQWRTLRQLAELENSRGLKNYLKKILEDSKDPFRESIVRDFVESLPVTLRPLEAPMVKLDQVGLNVSAKSLEPQATAELIEKFPSWAKILKNPRAELTKLIRKNDLGPIGALLDVAPSFGGWRKHKFYEALILSIGDAGDAKGAQGALELLFQQRNDFLDELIAEKLLSRPRAERYLGAAQTLLERGEPHVADRILDKFVELNLKDHPEMWQDALKKKSKMGYVWFIGKFDRPGLEKYDSVLREFVETEIHSPNMWGPLANVMNSAHAVRLPLTMEFMIQKAPLPYLKRPVSNLQGDALENNLRELLKRPEAVVELGPEIHEALSSPAAKGNRYDILRKAAGMANDAERFAYLEKRFPESPLPATSDKAQNAKVENLINCIDPLFNP